MLGSLGAAVYHPIRATSSRRGPWQVGAGASLGVLAGMLLIKSPLGALFLGVAFILPVHFAVAGATSLLTAGMLWTIEPALNELGSASLSQETTLRAMYWGYQFPGFALLRLNNTVVHGGLVLGLMQLFPTCFLIARLIYIARDHYEFVEQNEWLRADQAQEQVLKPHISFSKSKRNSEEETERIAESLGEALDAAPESPALPTAPVSQPTETASTQEPSTRDDLGLPSEDAEIPYLAWSDLSEVGATTGYEQSQLMPVELNPTLAFSGLTSNTVQLAIPGESFVLDSIAMEEPENYDEAELLRSEMVAELQEIEASDAPPMHGSAEDTLKESAKLERIEQLTQSEQPDSLSVAERAAELASLVDEMLTTLQEDDIPAPTETHANPMRMFDEGHSSMKIPLNPELAADSGQVNTPATHRNLDSGLHQRVDQASTVEKSGGSKEPLTLEDVAKHEDALRYLLHHLKEIKNRV